MLGGLLEDVFVTMRMLNNRFSQSVHVVENLGRGKTDWDVLDLTIAQRADSHVHQSYSG